MTGHYGSQRQPVGWAYLPEAYTIRWERFDGVAYIFAGNQVKTTPPDRALRVPVLATVRAACQGVGRRDLPHPRLKPGHAARDRSVAMLLGALGTVTS
ncbi:MAG: hypothetical protein ACRDRZ_08810 [Pseudonocardiaceae bacterium]